VGGDGLVEQAVPMVLSLALAAVPTTASSRPRVSVRIPLLRPTIFLPLSRCRDNGKRVNGRKRHIVTDTCGWLLAVAVTGANVQDRDAGRMLMWVIRTVFPTVRLVWADCGYAGKLVDYANTMLGITVHIVTKLAGQVGFVVLPCRWCVERTFSWINRCRRTVRDYERLPEHHAATVYWAMTIIMGRRLARHQAAGRILPQPARAP
jgi:putative transposase